MDPARQQPLPERGRRRRRALPLHARPSIRISPPACSRSPAPASATWWCGRSSATRCSLVDADCASQVTGLDQVPPAARASGSTAASSTWPRPPTRRSTSTTRTAADARGSCTRRATAGHAAAGIDNVLVTKSGDLMVAEDSYSNDPDAMDVCLITKANEVSRFLKITGDDASRRASEVVSIAFKPGRHAHVRRLAALQGHGHRCTRSAGRSGRDQATVYPDRTPTPTPRAHAVPAAPPRADARRPDRARSRRSGWRRRRSSATASRSAFTLDKAATVRVRITAKIGNRTKTLATVTRSAKRGPVDVADQGVQERREAAAVPPQGRQGDGRDPRHDAGRRPSRTFNRTVTLRQ